MGVGLLWTAGQVRELQARGVTVYAMETTEHARNYCAAPYPRATPADGDAGEAGEAGGVGGAGGGVALVLGNEQIGVDTAVLAAVDGTVEIPTFGLKNSLNVASAGAIVVYEVLRGWGLLAGDKLPAATVRGE